jgi:hypothetical protein
MVLGNYRTKLYREINGFLLLFNMRVIRLAFELYLEKVFFLFLLLNYWPTLAPAMVLRWHYYCIGFCYSLRTNLLILKPERNLAGDVTQIWFQNGLLQKILL